MTLTIAHPIYNNLLDTTLNSSHEALYSGHSEVDYSITEKTWLDTLKTVSMIVLKIVLFPWGIYETVRWCVQRLVMILQYPAQSWLVKNCFAKQFKTAMLDHRRTNIPDSFDENIIVRHVTLEKDGTRFSGILVGSCDTINNGKWVLQVPGNGGTAEGEAYFARKYQTVGYNTLVMNNPGIGRSEGLATPESILECQTTALSYLETALKAHRIVMAGYSLGGFAVDALNEYVEKNQTDVNFLAFRQMTFARASKMAAKMAPSFCVPNCLAEFLVHWTGSEMDNVASSKKLAEKNIREIILQGENDRVIPSEYSLLEGVEQLSPDLLKNKVLQTLPNTDHHDAGEVFDATLWYIQEWDQSLEEPIDLAE